MKQPTEPSPPKQVSKKLLIIVPLIILVLLLAAHFLGIISDAPLQPHSEEADNRPLLLEGGGVPH